MPAEEQELVMASFLYYQIYNEALPMQEYTKQDIHYIIDSLQHTIYTGYNSFEKQILH